MFRPYAHRRKHHAGNGGATMQLISDQFAYSDAGVTLATDTDGVEEWHSVEGDYEWSSPAAGNEPQYLDNQNGVLPALSNATGDFWDRAAGFRTSDTVGTFHFVVRPDAGVIDTTAGWLFSVTDTADSTDKFSIGVSLGKVRIDHIVNGTTNYRVDGATTLSANVWYYITVQSDGSKIYAWINGVSETLTPVIGTNAGEWFAAATGNNRSAVGVQAAGATQTLAFQGDIAEIRYYDTAQDADARSATWTEITDKWVFSPAEISGLELWLHGEAGITSDANGISDWADQSGGSHDAFQAVNANKPNISAASLNGLDTVIFVNANNEFMEIDYTLGTLADALNGSDLFTFLWVGKVTSANWLNALSWQPSSAGNMQLLHYQHALQVWQEEAAAITYIPGGNDNNWVYGGFHRSGDGGDWEIYKNGSSVATDTNADTDIATVASDFSIGRLWDGSQYADAEIAEMVLFNRALTAAELTYMWAYFTDKYAL